MKPIVATILASILLFSLAVCAPIPTSFDVEFMWAGDDGYNGTSAIIEWKYSTDSLDQWINWNMITDTITPQPGGTLDTLHFEVDFPDNGVFFVAAVQIDEAGNTSPVCVLGFISLADIDAPFCGSGTIINVTR